MESITSGAIDIYDEFGVAPTASSREISKRFRLLALRYHPDKNPAPEAREKFQLISLINSVLSDPLLRQQYDRVRHDATRITALSDPTVLEQIQRFREQLRAQEAREQAKRQQARSDSRSEKLRLEGLAHRREFQKLRQVAGGYVSFRDIALNGPISHFSAASDGRSVTVIWKLRNEPGAQITEPLLRELMGVFGAVSNCSVNAEVERYRTGAVTFETPEGAKLAVAHDYRQSASLWDGREVRKLASLLRSCKFNLPAPCWEDEYAAKLFRSL